MELLAEEMVRMRLMQTFEDAQLSWIAWVHFGPRRAWPGGVSGNSVYVRWKLYLKGGIFFLDSLKFSLCTGLSSIGLLKLSISFGL